MGEGIRLFKIQNASQRDLASYGKIFLVEASYQNYDSSQALLITDEFRLSIDSSLIKEVIQAYKNKLLWKVDMSRFQSKNDIPDVYGRIGVRTIHEEMVVINEDALKAMLDKAIRKTVLAQMGFAGLDELKSYTVKVTTIKDGYIYANHNLENVVAEDEDDAYNVMLSVLSQREGRIVHASDIFSCVIHSNGERLFDFNSK